MTPKLLFLCWPPWSPQGCETQRQIHIPVYVLSLMMIVYVQCRPYIQCNFLQFTIIRDLSINLPLIRRAWADVFSFSPSSFTMIRGTRSPAKELLPAGSAKWRCWSEYFGLETRSSNSQIYAQPQHLTNLWSAGDFLNSKSVRGIYRQFQNLPSRSHFSSQRILGLLDDARKPEIINGTLITHLLWVDRRHLRLNNKCVAFP